MTTDLSGHHNATWPWTPSWSDAQSAVNEASGPAWSSRAPTCKASSTALAARLHGDDPPGAGVHPDVSLAPGPALRVPCPARQPLARVAQRQLGVVPRQGARERSRAAGLSPAASRPCGSGEVLRRREIRAGQGEDGTDQPLGPVQGRAEGGPQRLHRGDGQDQQRGWPPRVVRRSAFQAAIAASVNQTAGCHAGTGPHPR